MQEALWGDNPNWMQEDAGAASPVLFLENLSTELLLFKASMPVASSFGGCSM